MRRWLKQQEAKYKTPLNSLKHLKADKPIDTLADTPADHEAQTFCHISRNVEAETRINTLTDKLEGKEGNRLSNSLGDIELEALIERLADTPLGKGQDAYYNNSCCAGNATFLNLLSDTACNTQAGKLLHTLAASLAKGNMQILSELLSDVDRRTVHHPR